jgi:hypothetical protein
MLRPARTLLDAGAESRDTFHGDVIGSTLINRAGASWPVQTNTMALPDPNAAASCRGGDGRCSHARNASAA